MTIDIPSLQKLLCDTFCQDVRVNMSEGQAVIALPMSARDGDQVMAYLSQTTAGWRVSDMGTTMMKLSYENDLSKLFSGARGQLLQTILNESGLLEDDGELFVEVPADALPRTLFTLGQGSRTLACGLVLELSRHSMTT